MCVVMEPDGACEGWGAKIKDPARVYRVRGAVCEGLAERGGVAQGGVREWATELMSGSKVELNETQYPLGLTLHLIINFRDCVLFISAFLSKTKMVNAYLIRGGV